MGDPKKDKANAKGKAAGDSKEDVLPLIKKVILKIDDLSKKLRNMSRIL